MTTIDLTNSALQPRQEDPWAVLDVHTLHPGVDYTWLSRCRRVFDATYGFAGAPA